MATELDDLHAIVEAERESGKRYMMMETSVYGREFLAVADLYLSGRLGGLSGYRGFHLQNLDGYPSYWRGFPPMKYATHAIAPLLALADTTVEQVVSFGTGRLTPERRGDHDNPYPSQVGLFTPGRTATSSARWRCRSSSWPAPTSRASTSTATRGSVEWPRVDGEPLRVHELLDLDPALPDRGLRGRRSTVADLHPPDHRGDLPEPLVPYLRDFAVPTGHGGTVVRAAEHGGSHPHLVHEFVSSILEDRPARVDAARAAAWTAPGICAHDSSLRRWRTGRGARLHPRPRDPRTRGPQ